MLSTALVMPDDTEELALTLNSKTMAFIFVVARGALVGIFSDNAEVVALSANLLLLIAIYQFSDAIQGLSISMLRGLQDVKIIMPIVLCSYLVLNIPLGTQIGRAHV